MSSKVRPTPLKKVQRDNNDNNNDDNDSDDGIVHTKKYNKFNIFVDNLFEFLSNTDSSRISFIWGWITAFLVICHHIVSALQTSDGPNQYKGRVDKSKFRFLLNDVQYFYLNLGIMVPILFDALCRFFLVLVIIFKKENHALLQTILKDPFNIILFMGEILGTFPYILNISGIIDYKKLDQLGSEGPNAIIRIIDLGLTLKMFRVLKDMRSIKALYLTVARASPYLASPCFFFVLFNIFGGTAFYFIEPCYDGSNLFQSCPWTSLFDTTFFTVVTMTTTGYGNQVPSYIHSRFFAVIVMLFGSLFMSMPLAIIGNEYTNTCHEVNAEYNAKSRRRLLKKRVRTLLAQRKNIYFNSLSQSSAALTELAPKYLSDEIDPSFNSSEDLEIVKLSPILFCVENVEKVVEYARFCVSKKNKLSPMAILSVFELQSAFGTLSFNVANCLDEFQKLNTNTEERDTIKVDNNVTGDTKRMSLVSIALAQKALSKLSNKVATMKSKQPAFDDETKASINNRKNGNTLFSKRYDEYMQNPKSTRNRLWLVLELHHSSTMALFIHFFSITIIIFSVIMFFSQSALNFIHYGENSKYCENVVKAYCSDKNDFNLDPGCFIHGSNGVTSSKLLFNCDRSTCYGQYSNFGSTNSNLTCISSDNNMILPFQSKDDLTYKYGNNDFTVTQSYMQLRRNVCNRIECMDNKQTAQGNTFWFYGEIFINFFFTVEFILRIIVSNSVRGFIFDAYNQIDLWAIVPFYIEIIDAFILGTSKELEFQMLPSQPNNGLFYFKALKVFRLFKLMRHFESSTIFYETASKVGRTIYAVLSIIIFMTVIFSVILYGVEQGQKCYVGDIGCKVPEGLIVRTGDLIYVNKLDNPSNFKNALYGLWFSFVTLTTTGYGDYTPVTNVGQVMAVLLMLFGICIMSMPLGTASNTFYTIFKRTHDTKGKEIAAILSPVTSSTGKLNRQLEKAIKALQKLQADISKFIDQMMIDEKSVPASTNNKVSSLMGRYVLIMQNTEDLVRNFRRTFIKLAAIQIDLHNKFVETKSRM